MEAMVTTGDDDEMETHIGITVCEGPRNLRMVLTRPYHEAGRIIEIPREDISSIEAVAPGTLGETPGSSTARRPPTTRRRPLALSHPAHNRGEMPVGIAKVTRQ